jgi:hypothetical protein
MIVFQVIGIQKKIQQNIYNVKNDLKKSWLSLK